MEIIQVNIATAYLNGKIDVEFYTYFNHIYNPQAAFPYNFTKI